MDEISNYDVSTLVDTLEEEESEQLHAQSLDSFFL